jgi:hypothetical protein
MLHHSGFGRLQRVQPNAVERYLLTGGTLYIIAGLPIAGRSANVLHTMEAYFTWYPKGAA